MGYNNNQGNSESGYKKELDLEIYKGSVKSEKRFLNVGVFSYNNGPVYIRIRPTAKNSNPDQNDPKKKWINLPGINQITKEEAQGLIEELKKAIDAM